MNPQYKIAELSHDIPTTNPYNIIDKSSVHRTNRKKARSIRSVSLVRHHLATFVF